VRRSELLTRFFCTSCGSETLKWEGRCPTCGEWNALAEAPAGVGAAGGREGARDPGEGRADGMETGPVVLREARGADGRRHPTGVGEMDRVLGGGIVPGSLVLLGGAPGIGKSTLLLQMAARVLANGGSVLYASGEESAGQVARRAERLGGAAGEVPFLAATAVEEIVRHAGAAEPLLLCVDSVQTLHAASVDSSPGNVAQVRECAARLQALAKERGVAIFLVGHVTKEGGLAGPRTLEHLVDAVILFEGERTLEHRVVRSIKNRFGSVDEMAVFRMGSGGLEPVLRPSDLFLADRRADVSGSAVAVPLHGSRPLLTEVQALTAAARYGSPQRVSAGVSPRRLSLLLAVLERRAGLATGDGDVFVNVVGGLELADPAADLAVLAALASAELDVPAPVGVAFVGEVGLGGEVRGASQVERRLREVERSGLDGIALPENPGKRFRTDLRVHPVDRVADLVSLLREGGAEGGRR